MNTDFQQATRRQDRPLTRADVEQLLQQVGSSKRLVLQANNLRGADLGDLRLAEADLSDTDFNELFPLDLAGRQLAQQDRLFQATVYHS